MATKRGCWMLVAILAAAALVTIAAVAIVALSPRVTYPVVRIDSPRNAARLMVGQDTAIRATARDDAKIKRVELWVDDKLLDAQNTNVTGGISPFPLTMHWRPTMSGTHTLIVRAFNAQGARSHATMNVQAIQPLDHDQDGWLDPVDQCPEQAGTGSARGCPDRDDDGVADRSDACPEQAGPSSNRGCPAQSVQDRDGDGSRDADDACPDQLGSRSSQGCPDGDGDGVRDSADACPNEAGVAQNGCPTPGDSDGDGIVDASDTCPGTPGPAQYAGCPDDDGDGVPYQNDACPDAPGSAQLGGCPDNDGDGVRDAIDLCPASPGPVSNSGCPVSSAGDADNDGVRDDVDLVPAEAGPADQGGSPAPGQGADRNGNQVPDDTEPHPSQARLFGMLTIPRLELDLSDVIPGGQPAPKAMTTVEIEGLLFRTNRADYDTVGCHVYLQSTVIDATTGAETHIEVPIDAPDLHPSYGDYEWNLPEVLGSTPETTLNADDLRPVVVTVECTASGTDEDGITHSYDLGDYTGSHYALWNPMNILEGDSVGGDDGRGFHVAYRLCQTSCDVTDFPGPILTLEDDITHRTLEWTWQGDAETIDGFNLYLNGALYQRYLETETNYATGFATGSFRITPAYDPPCDGRDSYYVTARIDIGSRKLESAPSNAVVVPGRPCSRTVRVYFDTLQTGDLGSDESDMSGVGPIFGEIWASGSARRTLGFWITRCPELGVCSHHDVWFGRRLSSNAEYEIQEIFDTAISMGYGAPSVNFVDVDLGWDDDLSYGARIMDMDWGYSAWDDSADPDLARSVHGSYGQLQSLA